MHKVQNATTNHILACVGEECGEIQQMVGKCLRFGLHSDNHKSEDKKKNIELLLMEFNDLVAVIEMLADNLGIEQPIISPKDVAAKKAKVISYMTEVERYDKTTVLAGVSPWADGNMGNTNAATMHRKINWPKSITPGFKRTI
jgi:NTP pyrophosphatase (non-canonical NTP hydrolase)